MKTLLSGILATGMIVSALGAADLKTTQLSLSNSAASKYDVSDMFEFTRPDLSVSMFSYQRSRLIPGEGIPQGTYEIYSREGALETPVEVTFFLTPRFNIAFDNTEDFITLQRVKVTIDAVENRFTFPDTLAIPKAIDTGFYYLGIHVDSKNTYAEINENNNMTNFGLHVVEPAPGLYQFRVSQDAVSWTDIVAQENACKDAFGNDARIATWENIERFIEEGGDASELASQIMLESWSLFINHEGGALSSGGGKYMIQKGNPNFKLQSAINSVGNHTIDLVELTGSSWAMRHTAEPVLCIDPVQWTLYTME